MWIKVTGSYSNQASTASSSGSWFLDRATASSALVSLVPVGTGAGQFGYQTRYDDGTGFGGPSGGTVSANWTHVVMVRDYNTAFRLYVNGTQVGTTTDSGSEALTPPIPKIGRHQSYTVNSASQASPGMRAGFRLNTPIKSLLPHSTPLGRRR
jgi:hypothetical protein